MQARLEEGLEQGVADTLLGDRIAPSPDVSDREMLYWRRVYRLVRYLGVGPF
jgi:hypothetical protein